MGVNTQSWVQVALVSAFFFFITAATFTSLGVALPFMIRDLSWSGSEAGTGFSLFALTLGLAGAVPAWILRKFGIKATFVLGGVCLGAGFVLLATTASLAQYFAGALLLGLGYALCANVPGVHIINNWLPEKRSFALGVYLTVGGLGGVAGPLVVTSVVALTHSWRYYWWSMMGAVLFLALLALLFLKERETHEEEEQTALPNGAAGPKGIYVTRQDWLFREAVRTPQFFIIVAALTMSRFSGITMNSWAFTHMTSLGVAAAVAAGALSSHAIVNSLARALGGGLATRIDPKWLLVSAMVGEGVGMLALSVADNPVAITLFVLGEGFGFGMCLFSTTMILVNYFGSEANPEILGTVTMITTLAMVGPVLGGWVADKFGGFAGVFQGYALVILLIIIATAVMSPPRLKRDVASGGSE